MHKGNCMKKKWKVLLFGAAFGCMAALAACTPSAQIGEHEHCYGDWSVKTPADCKTEGIKVRKCAVCGNFEEEKISAAGHVFDGGKVKKHATCTEAGVITRTCTVCGEERDFAISPLNHDWDAGVVQSEATCNNTGITLHTCLKEGCGEKWEEETSALGHNWEILSQESVATCETAGRRRVRCTRCSEEETQEQPALGHDMVDGEILREANCTDGGIYETHCTRYNCNEKGTRTTDPLGHSWEDDYTVDQSSTFESEGSRSNHCRRCEARNNVQTIPKLDQNTPIEYELRLVRNSGERLALSSVTIGVYEGDQKIKESTRSELVGGVYTVSLLPKTYTIRLSNLPEGYTAETEYTVEAGDPRCNLNLTAKLLSDNVDPNATDIYTIGSVMHDFTYKTIDGTTVTLSDLLREKKVVMLNFWATWCTPCQQEFPAIIAAYNRYQSDVAVLAIDQDVTEEEVLIRSFRDRFAMPFAVASDNGHNLYYKFKRAGNSIPMTVIIDGEGVVCEIHLGSMNQEDVENYFAKYSSPYYWKYGNKKAALSKVTLPMRRKEEEI